MVSAKILRKLGIEEKDLKRGSDGRIFWSPEQKEILVAALLESGLTVGAFSEGIGIWSGLIRAWTLDAGLKLRRGVPVAPAGGPDYPRLRGAPATPSAEEQPKRSALSEQSGEDKEAQQRRLLAEAGVNVDALVVNAGGARRFTQSDREAVMRWLDANYKGRIAVGAELLGIQPPILYRWRAEAKALEGAKEVQSQLPATERARVLTEAGISPANQQKMEALERPYFTIEERDSILNWIDANYPGRHQQGAAFLGLKPSLIEKWTQRYGRSSPPTPVTPTPQQHPLVGQNVEIHPQSGRVTLPWNGETISTPSTLAPLPQTQNPATQMTRAGFLAFETQDLESAVALLSHLTHAIEGRVRVVVERSEG